MVRIVTAEPRYPYLPKGVPSPERFLATQLPVQAVNLAAMLAELTRPVIEVGESLLASATYDGDRRMAVL